MKVLFKNILLLSLLTTFALSQGLVIKGVITDENGNYLQDVNIRDKNTARGTISNGNGSYQLNLPFQKKYTITFSHINHAQKTLEISLKEAQQEMNLTNTNFLLKNFSLSKATDVLNNVDLISEENRFQGVTQIQLKTINLKSPRAEVVKCNLRVQHSKQLNKLQMLAVPGQYASCVRLFGPPSAHMGDYVR